jgi:hypothetical protein
MPNDHFRPRVGRDGHDSRLSKNPQTPMNSTKLNRNATTFDLRNRNPPREAPSPWLDPRITMDLPPVLGSGIRTLSSWATDSPPIGWGFIQDQDGPRWEP